MCCSSDIVASANIIQVVIAELYSHYLLFFLFELKQIVEITTEALLSVEYYWTCNKQIIFTPVDVAVNPVDKDCLFYFSMRKASLIPSADYALSENVVPPISRVEVELSPEGGGRIRFGKLIHVAK